MALSRIKQFELELQRDLTLQRVDSILDNSPPILREKVEWIRNTFKEEWRRSIVTRFELATAIRDIYDDVTDNGGAVYGAKAVEVIKKAFDWDDGVIYRALNVANAFTPEQIESMTQMRQPSGKPLSYSHIAALSRVEDEAHREKLLKQTVKEGWTSRRLDNAVQRADNPEPDKPPERRGRPLARPRDFDAVLDQQGSFAQDFLNRNDQVWSHPAHSLSSKLEDLDTADFTQVRADKLRRHAEVMALLAKKATERADEAKRVHTHFMKVVKEVAAKHKKLGSPRAAEGEAASA